MYRCGVRVRFFIIRLVSRVFFYLFISNLCAFALALNRIPKIVIASTVGISNLQITWFEQITELIENVFIIIKTRRRQKKRKLISHDSWNGDRPACCYNFFFRVWHCWWCFFAIAIMIRQQNRAHIVLHHDRDTGCVSSAKRKQQQQQTHTHTQRERKNTCCSFD